MLRCFGGCPPALDTLVFKRRICDWPSAFGSTLSFLAICTSTYEGVEYKNNLQQNRTFEVCIDSIIPNTGDSLLLSKVELCPGVPVD